jgi:hypothetical protein
MPWSETSLMDERLQFVADLRRAHESMTTLCDRYGISRKTGYQVWARYQAEGVVGLLELTACPRGSAVTTGCRSPRPRSRGSRR